MSVRLTVDPPTLEGWPSTKNQARTHYWRAGTPAGVTAIDSTDVLVDVIHQGRDALLVDDHMCSSLSPEGHESPHTMYAALKE